jgi:hypothetical protein
MTIPEVLITLAVVLASAAYYLLSRIGEMLALQDERDEAEE